MTFSFDYNGNYEYPILILARPDFTEISIMEQAKGIKFTPRFNTISELEFTVYEYLNEFHIPYYEHIRKNKLVKIEGTGWFVIDEVLEGNDGGVPTKTAKCFSYEYTINNKGINLYDGTYKFYDPINKEGTLLFELMKVLPKWKIGHVDVNLLNLFRTFTIPETTLYGFLTKEVSTTYECIFIFDVDNLTINAYEPKSLVKETGIVLTFDNVNKKIDVNELSDEIATVLRVNGADNLSIDRVNPVGSNKIYNFHYYMNENWIADNALIAKIIRWEQDIETNRPQYIIYLNIGKTLNKDIIKLRAQLVDLNNELSALELVRKNILSLVQSTNGDPIQAQALTDITNQVNEKNNQIRSKETEITNKQNEINTNTNKLNDITNTLRFENYFTSEELLKLEPYIIEQTYQDENFIVTDSMTTMDTDNGDTLVLTTTGVKKIKDLLETDILIDAQYIAQQLLEQGYKVIDRISQPTFSFSLNAINFLFVEKFKPFINQIQLGHMINVEIKDGDWAYPFLLEMQIDYDNPNSFSMTFGNRFRLGTEEWTWGDLYNETSKTSSKVGSTLAIAAEPILNGSVNEMAEMLASNIDASLRSIVSTEDAEFTFGSYGLRGRKKDSKYASGYAPQQIWMNENLIVMTDDEWQTAKLAIGYVNGYYSVNAEIIAGHLIAGHQLIIQDGVKGHEVTFVVDASGARLTNAAFVLDRKNASGTVVGRIILNPEGANAIQGVGGSGIRIQTTDNGTSPLRDVFYVDTAGRLMASSIYVTGGTVAGASGVGINISGTRLYSNAQSSTTYLNSVSGKTTTTGLRPVIDLNNNGTGKLGLLSWNTDNARFDGAIYAKEGTVGGFVIEESRLYSTATSMNKLTNVASPTIEFNSKTGTGRIGNVYIDTARSYFYGNIYAESGTIGANASGTGGFNIETYRLYSSATSLNKRTNNANDPTIWFNPSNGTGRIGDVYLESGATHFYGNIYATGGTIGGFIIGSDYIRSSNGALALYSNYGGAGRGHIVIDSATIGGLYIDENSFKNSGGNTYINQRGNGYLGPFHWDGRDGSIDWDSGSIDWGVLTIGSLGYYEGVRLNSQEDIILNPSNGGVGVRGWLQASNGVGANTLSCDILFADEVQVGGQRFSDFEEITIYAYSSSTSSTRRAYTVLAYAD